MSFRYLFSAQGLSLSNLGNIGKVSADNLEIGVYIEKGVFSFLEQELLKGMDKCSAVNPTPEPMNCTSLLAGRGKRMVQ